MLEINNLSINLPGAEGQWTTIVNNIDLTIATGEVLALVGESGSGKSMTALSIMRLLPTKARYSIASKIYVHGRDILNVSESTMRTIRGANVAMIFQEPMTSLNPILTIGAQITEVLSLHQHLRGRHAYVEALRLLDAVQISEVARRFDNYPHELSGGMRQRVMIAMALAGKPSLLIADEPTTALDVTTQAQILKLLQQLQRSENMAMLLITHDLAIAAQYADRVAVMQAGKIVEQNTKSNFFAAPQHEYSQKLLASVPRMILDQRIIEAPMEQILQVTDLRVYFPIKKGLLRRTVGYVKAVDGLQFKLYAGKTLAIVGESGSGKSTVGKAILALLTEASGDVQYAGKNLLQLTAKQWQAFRSDLQIIFQDPFTALNPKLRVIDSLEEGLIIQNKYETKRERYNKIDQLLIQVGLHPEHKQRFPHEFSGGERQRLCIARALSVEPKIIICDEPTSSLDVSVQAQVLQLLKDVQAKQRITYLFISHDLKVVSSLAHEVAVMRNGKIVEYGPTADVLQNPQHDYTKTLLAAVPQL